MPAPGRAHRKGLTTREFVRMFPDETTAEAWFEQQVWPDGRYCPKCGSINTRAIPNRKPMPYRCRDCRDHFSVRSGTALANSKVSMCNWAEAIYLFLSALKSVSSMKLHRDLGVTQKTAWFMLHRLRQAFEDANVDLFEGPVEVDETYLGGKRRNMPKAKRRELSGRGAVGKTAIVGARDRATKKIVAKVVHDTTKPTLQGFVQDVAAPGAQVFTDEHQSYQGMEFSHDTVKHGNEEYVRGIVHVNGMEGHWSQFKRAYHGTWHSISPKHTQRYIDEFAAKQNFRDQDTLDQMQDTAAGLVGKRLMYRTLIEDVGLPSGAKPVAKTPG